MTDFFHEMPASPAIDRFVDLSFNAVDAIMASLKRAGMTQRDLAARLGKHESEVSKWMNGTHNFTIKTLAAIETAIGMDFVEFTHTPLREATESIETEKTGHIQNGEEFYKGLWQDIAYGSTGGRLEVAVINEVFSEGFDYEEV